MRNYVIYVMHDGQMVHPITWQAFSESACPFPNTFQGRLPRWFGVTTHLDHQVNKSRHTTSTVVKRPNLHLDFYNNNCNNLSCALPSVKAGITIQVLEHQSKPTYRRLYVDIYVSIIPQSTRYIVFLHCTFLGFINEGVTVAILTASLIEPLNHLTTFNSYSIRYLI